MKKISRSEHHELFIIGIKLIATHNALNGITQAGKLVVNYVNISNEGSYSKGNTKTHWC